MALFIFRSINVLTIRGLGTGDWFLTSPMSKIDLAKTQTPMPNTPPSQILKAPSNLINLFTSTLY